MAASMKQNNSDEVFLNSSSKSIAINETKGHYPTALMTYLPPRCRKEDKCVAVTLLLICERVIKNN
jgi:hypothetical protein